MRFFTDPTPFTHRARFYGVPCYYLETGNEGCSIAGTNAIFDWLVLHICPWLHWLTEWVRGIATGEHEPLPFPIELRGELPKAGPRLS